MFETQMLVHNMCTKIGKWTQVSLLFPQTVTMEMGKITKAQLVRPGKELPARNGRNIPLTHSSKYEWWEIYQYVVSISLFKPWSWQGERINPISTQTSWKMLRLHLFGLILRESISQVSLCSPNPFIIFWGQDWQDLKCVIRNHARFLKNKF